MSLRYLLDGYNIINKIPALVPKKLEDARQGLVQLIELYRPQGSLKNSVTVVFDGAPGIWGRSSSGSVKIVFSRARSADDEIKALVENAPDKKQTVVVTDDRAIKYYVRPLGATVLSVKDFLAKCQPRAKIKSSHTKSSRAGRGGKKKIPTAEEYKITKELEHLWLKKENKSQ